MAPNRLKPDSGSGPHIPHRTWLFAFWTAALCEASAACASITSAVGSLADRAALVANILQQGTARCLPCNQCLRLCKTLFACVWLRGFRAWGRLLADPCHERGKPFSLQGQGWPATGPALQPSSQSSLAVQPPLPLLAPCVPPAARLRPAQERTHIPTPCWQPRSIQLPEFQINIAACVPKLRILDCIASMPQLNSMVLPDARPWPANTWLFAFSTAAWASSAMSRIYSKAYGMFVWDRLFWTLLKRTVQPMLSYGTQLSMKTLARLRLLCGLVRGGRLLLSCLCCSLLLARLLLRRSDLHGGAHPKTLSCQRSTATRQ